MVRIAQDGGSVFKHEFGVKILSILTMKSVFTGNGRLPGTCAAANLKKGPARVFIEVEKAAEARRHVDCFVLTNDFAYKPSGRLKPDFAAMRFLREWDRGGKPIQPLISQPHQRSYSGLMARPQVAGRDFFMPWNINTEFWTLYDKPA